MTVRSSHSQSPEWTPFQFWNLSHKKKNFIRKMKAWRMAQWLSDLLTSLRTRVSDAQKLHKMPGGYDNLLAIPASMWRQDIFRANWLVRLTILVWPYLSEWNRPAIEDTKSVWSYLSEWNGLAIDDTILVWSYLSEWSRPVIENTILVWSYLSEWSGLVIEDNW